MMLLCGFLIAFGGTWRLCVVREGFVDILLGGMSVGVALMAAGIFGLCPTKWNRVAAYISKASFCIYLVHVFFLYLTMKIGFNSSMFASFLSVPVVTAAIFVCSCAVYAVFSKIPLVNRWLI
jgi:surface polysaccharide O-acyltransferase-like enzyme